MTLPEGRKPITWADMEFADDPKGYPSTWEAEARALREENDRLRAELQRVKNSDR